MKRISPLIYESLTPKQRVVAYVEALSRGDENERLRLIRSCPKLTYVQSDARFSEAMQKLMGLAMAVEADLRDCVLKFLVVVTLEPETAGRFLQDFANIREAWRMTVRAIKIDEKSMALAGPPSSLIFELIKNRIPEPDSIKAEKLANDMIELISDVLVEQHITRN